MRLLTIMPITEDARLLALCGGVLAEGLEPSRTLRSNGLSDPATAFAAAHRFRGGFGSGLSLHDVPDGSGILGAARLVSTPCRPF